MTSLAVQVPCCTCVIERARRTAVLLYYKERNPDDIHHGYVESQCGFLEGEHLQIALQQECMHVSMDDEVDSLPSLFKHYRPCEGMLCNIPAMHDKDLRRFASDLDEHII